MTIQLLDVNEAAAILRCKPGWLSKAAASGEVPSRKIGRRRLFTEDDLAAYIERAKEQRDPWARSNQQKAALRRRTTRRPA